MTFKQSPCMGCAMRYIGCHSDCSAFVDWKASENVKNAELKVKMSVEANLCDTETQHYFKAMAKRNRESIRGHYAW